MLGKEHPFLVLGRSRTESFKKDRVMARPGLKPVVSVHGCVCVYRTVFVYSANSQLNSFDIYGRAVGIVQDTYITII